MAKITLKRSVLTSILRAAKTQYDQDIKTLSNAGGQERLVEAFKALSVAASVLEDEIEEKDEIQLTDA